MVLAVGVLESHLDCPSATAGLAPSTDCPFKDWVACVSNVSMRFTNSTFLTWMSDDSDDSAVLLFESMKLHRLVLADTY